MTISIQLKSGHVVSTEGVLTAVTKHKSYPNTFMRKVASLVQKTRHVSVRRLTKQNESGCPYPAHHLERIWLRAQPNGSEVRVSPT